MRFFFSYLWRSPLIRLALIWFVIAIAGISVFSWRLTGMREELALTNKRVQAHVQAIQELEIGQVKNRTEIDDILDEIQNYRPTVEELLTFVKDIEKIGEQNKVYLFFHTVKTSITKAKKNENFVSYKAGFRGTLEQVQFFLDEFEKLPYATDTESIDISLTPEGNYVLRLIFILYTKF